MKLNIKITCDEIKQLVADRLKLNKDFTLEVVDSPRLPDPSACTGMSELATLHTNVAAGYVAGVFQANGNTAIGPDAKIAEGSYATPGVDPKPAMLPALDGYDWAEVFGEGTGGNCTPIIPSAPPGSDVSTTTFGRADVISIQGQEEGENDGADWIVWGQLKDGRWFIARGGCDYTGWDCRAGNSGNVALTRMELIQFGMSEEERARFKVPLPLDDKTKPVTSR